MLGGMPRAADLHRAELDGEVLIAVGSRVLFRFPAADTGLRNLAAVTLPEWGFTGRRVAEVLGVTEEYVSMLRARVRRDGSAALMRRQGRPPALGERQLAVASRMRGEGRPDTAIAERLGVHAATIVRALGRRADPPAAEQNRLGEDAVAAGADTVGAENRIRVTRPASIRGCGRRSDRAAAREDCPDRRPVRSTAAGVRDGQAQAGSP